MTALLICLAMLAVISINFSNEQAMKQDWKKKHCNTNVKLQDELEKKYFVQIINDLKRMDSVNRLYGDKLITAFRVLFDKYHLSFPDVEGHYVYQNKSQKNKRIYATATECFRDACHRYETQLRIRFTTGGAFSFLSPIPPNNKLETYSLWRHIWLEYSPFFDDEPPIIKHPELLYSEPYKMKFLEKDNGVKYFDKDGKRAMSPSKNEKATLYKYVYHPVSFRLFITTATPIPVYLLNDLVVKLTDKELKNRGFQYSPDRRNSQYINEKTFLEQEKIKYHGLDDEK